MTTGFRRVCIVVASLSTPLVAQEPRDSSTTGHFHVGLTIHDWGISVGNAPRVNGVRINIQDAALERVNGINLTLWKPREPLTGTVNGIQAGLVPGSQVVSGVALGVGGVVAEQRSRWVTGLSVSAYNRVRGPQRGLTIGLYNSAYELHGVQIGVLNRAKNNRAPFKILPVLNVHR